jgi:F-type H+-transporting ATPase subunit b
MPARNQALTVLLLVPFFLFMISEEGGEAAGKSDFLGKAINFVVLFGGLAYLLAKPLRNYLSKRSEDIRRALDEARQARLDAEGKLQEARKKLAVLEDEVGRIIKAAENDGFRAKENIKALAEKEAERIKTFARQEIEMQLRAGRQELKEYTAELAASLAEARLKDKITAQGHSRLIDKSIDKLAELYEKPSPD